MLFVEVLVADGNVGGAGGVCRADEAEYAH